VSPPLCHPERGAKGLRVAEMALRRPGDASLDVQHDRAIALSMTPSDQRYFSEVRRLHAQYHIHFSTRILQEAWSRIATLERPLLVVPREPRED
jgi:hypothetical protein